MISSKKRWKQIHRALRVARREALKASMDVVVFGVGAVFVDENGVAKRVQVRELMRREKRGDFDEGGERMTATECINGMKRANQEFVRAQKVVLQPFIDRAVAIIEESARLAYEYADAMIKARGK